MIRCRECVMPDTRPDTPFIDGVCAACVAFKKRPEVDWRWRHDELAALVIRAKEFARTQGNAYDCIVPSSGGKDSHFQVLTLLEHGARPLVVTASTCHLTPIGRTNIDNLARYATTVEVTPLRELRAKLNKLGLTMVGDISWPEHVSIFCTPFKVAQMTGIPFLFYGENPQNQYGGPLGTQEAQQMTRRWISEFGGHLGLRPQDVVHMDGITEQEMADYRLPESFNGTEAHFLGHYVPWDSHLNAHAAKVAGMRWGMPSEANAWPFENLDNAQTGLHDHGMYRKYGFGRGCVQLSVDIRMGRMERGMALDWCQKNDGKFPFTYAGVHYREVIERLGITSKGLEQAMNRFTNWPLFDAHPELQRPPIAL